MFLYERVCLILYKEIQFRRILINLAERKEFTFKIIYRESKDFQIVNAKVDSNQY